LRYPTTILKDHRQSRQIVWRAYQGQTDALPSFVIWKENHLAQALGGWEQFPSLTACFLKENDHEELWKESEPQKLQFICAAPSRFLCL
jgi:hypothetical protein